MSNPSLSRSLVKAALGKQALSGTFNLLIYNETLYSHHLWLRLNTQQNYAPLQMKLAVKSLTSH